MKRTMDLNNIENGPTASKVILVERNSQPNGITLVNSKRVATKSFEETMELEENQDLANRFLKSTLNNKLDVIGRQAKSLQDLLVDVIMEAKLSKELNNAACNFVKIPGHVYHLYERPSGQKYLSMLSPEDWINPPHQFIGSYYLEGDMSWKQFKEVNNKFEGVNFLKMIMGAPVNETLANLGFSDCDM